MEKIETYQTHILVCLWVKCIVVLGDYMTEGSPDVEWLGRGDPCVTRV